MKKNQTRRALLLSVLSLLLCVSMLVGTTFAWFTDSVATARNTIQSGNLDVVLEHWDTVQKKYVEVDSNTKLFDDAALWEPGYTEVAYLKVSNAGSLALKYQMAVTVFNETLGKTKTDADIKLSDYLQFKVVESDTDLVGTYATREAAQAAPATATKLQTYNSQVKALEAKNEAGDNNYFDYVALIIYMPTTVGNEANHNGVNVPKIEMGVSLFATQQEAESDSFGTDYDKNAHVITAVSSLKEFFDAIEAGNDIELQDTIVIDDAFMTYVGERFGTSATDVNALIDGNGVSIFRTESMLAKPIFEVATGYTLTLSNITVDGGAEWAGTVDPCLLRGTENTGLKTTANLIKGADNSHIVLNAGAVLQNNDGASAIYPSFKSNATVTLNGGWILNNSGDGGGAIWGGGHITVNAGSKINGNASASIGGAIRMVSGRNFTMTGGEMNHNKAGSNGGAIWGGGSRTAVCTYVLSGGEMAYNTAEAGGAIWTGVYEKYTISGDFALHDNSAAVLGGAIRFCDHTSLTMEGGKVYDNAAAGESNAFFLNNNSAIITAGEIKDNFSYSGGLGLTLGEADIQGTIDFGLATVHNTVYLAAAFSGVEFTVDESASNFANFNFKPAAGYTYTAGDEAKLVCLNEGYSTYWDAATGTFRLQAN